VLVLGNAGVVEAGEIYDSEPFGCLALEWQCVRKATLRSGNDRILREEKYRESKSSKLNCVVVL
jgi:hypothetical protein